jgi:hypothetical protein
MEQSFWGISLAGSGGDGGWVLVDTGYRIKPGTSFAGMTVPDQVRHDEIRYRHLSAGSLV